MEPKLAIDANGNRILTDILVSGYIREHMKKYIDLSIPNEIINLLFLFWFVNICDTWDKLSSYSFFDINGAVLKLNKKENEDCAFLCSAFGYQTVENGIFEWKIKFNTRIEWICIGIIPDYKQSLEKDVTDNNYGFSESGGGCFLLSVNGAIYHGSSMGYCPIFHDKDTIITVILDMDNNTLSYKINDQDHGVAWDAIKHKKYRLAVTMRDDSDEIEFL